MRRLALLLLALALASPLVACPGPTGEGDSDAGGGAPDAGPADAGPPDAGPTGPGDAGVGPGDGGEEADAGEPLPPLALTAVLPPRGALGGGALVTLVGSGFVRGAGTGANDAQRRTTLRFGSNPVQELQVVDDTTVDVRTPPGLAGPVDVTLANDRGTVVCAGCFTYFEEVTLRGLSPREGPVEGGLDVTLTGTGFTEGMTVLFRVPGPDGLAVSRRSPRVTRVSSAELRAVVPRGVGGERADLLVYSENGAGQLRRAFRWWPEVRVTELGVEVAGALRPWAEVGGPDVKVVLRGTGLGEPGVMARLGDAPPVPLVAEPAPLGGTQYTATLPAGLQPGVVDVTVSSALATWTVLRGFAWVPSTGGTPELHGALPRLHAGAGGSLLWLVGQALGGATEVRVDGAPVSIEVRSAGALAVRVPAAPLPSATAMEVEVDVPTGTLTLPAGPVDLRPLYRVEARALDVTRGARAGGTAVALTGAHLPADAQVRVGALQAGPVVLGTTSASFSTPPGSTGAPSDVVVRSAGDPENEALLPGAFLYEAPVALGRLQPGRGAISGGTLVTVLGEGFGEDTVVDFGRWRAKDVKVLDAHTLTLRIPKGEPGVVDVHLSRPVNGQLQQETRRGAFSFFDPRNLSGGLSGGALAGSLNVSVLDGTRERHGAPIPLAEVMLGTDPATPFQGTTDHRGQLTFSDAALVKAQTVTVWKEGFTSSTVAGVNAQNLTVFVTSTGGEGQPGNPPPGPLASFIRGRVTGFKAPRPLAQGEQLEARVFVAQSSPFGGAPFLWPSQRQGETWVLARDGDVYSVATAAGTRTVYAVLGIRQGSRFTPHLMGVRRGIRVRVEESVSDQDVVLDMHLDGRAPVSLEGPLLDASGQVLPTLLYAWLDLGGEGWVPHPLNWRAGTSTQSEVVADGAETTFPGLPELDGSSFLFMALAFAGEEEFSLGFRRQPGELGEGLRVPPLLQVARFTAPTTQTGLTDGVLSWRTAPGPTPDLQLAELEVDTPFGFIPRWEVVLPGGESQVALPPAPLALLRREAAGAAVRVRLTSSRMPRFRYDQWNTESLSALSWTGFAVGLSEELQP